jgi:hypothetical protein
MAGGSVVLEVLLEAGKQPWTASRWDRFPHPQGLAPPFSPYRRPETQGWPLRWPSSWRSAAPWGGWLTASWSKHLWCLVASKELAWPFWTEFVCVGICPYKPAYDADVCMLVAEVSAFFLCHASWVCYSRKSLAAFVVKLVRLAGEHILMRLVCKGQYFTSSVSI